MKYKLINTTTNQETLCDKVTIDGFDYYVSDEQAPEGFYGYINFQGGDVKKIGKYFADDWKKVIATNNPNIDVPKVVDEVVKLSNEHQKIELELGKTLEGAVCSKYGFMTGYNKSQETHPFSEEDMIDFIQWCAKNYVATIASKELRYWQKGTYQNKDCYYSTKELLQLWKEQEPKIVWYE